MGAERQRKILAIAFVVFFAIVNPSFASPKDKLFRGVQNISVFPAEIPKHAVQEGMKANPDFLAPLYGGIYGIVEGGAYAFSRAVSGLVDILTFPVNIPDEWKQAIPIQKFTFEESLDQVTS